MQKHGEANVLPCFSNIVGRMEWGSWRVLSVPQPLRNPGLCCHWLCRKPSLVLRNVIDFEREVGSSPALSVIVPTWWRGRVVKLERWLAWLGGNGAKNRTWMVPAWESPRAPPLVKSEPVLARLTPTRAASALCPFPSRKPQAAPPSPSATPLALPPSRLSLSPLQCSIQATIYYSLLQPTGRVILCKFDINACKEG